MASTTQSVQCFGKKKTATAVAQCKVRAFATPMHTEWNTDLFSQSRPERVLSRLTASLSTSSSQRSSASRYIAPDSCTEMDGRDGNSGPISDTFCRIALRASPNCRPRQVRWCRHPRPCHRWWTHFPDLRYPSSNRQVPRCLLPEVRR